MADGAGLDGQIIHLHFMMAAARAVMTALGDQRIQGSIGEVNHYHSRSFAVIEGEIYHLIYCILLYVLCQLLSRGLKNHRQELQK